jgi:DNA invertase Pin-like site-specific DNA recombinase
MKAALYARVSTRNHGQDVQVQTRDLEQFAEARGWQLLSRLRNLWSKR